VSALPKEFLALLTRARVASMLMETYAKVRNVDLDESHARLYDGFSDLRLLSGLQAATWEALDRVKPDADRTRLVTRAERVMGRRRRFPPMWVGRRDEAAFVALSVAIDRAAGVGSGESAGLLDSPEGEALVVAGLHLVAKHIAHDMTK
jgi:hypothetical protein